MVTPWVASLPCRPGPPLSGGTAVAVTVASSPVPAGISARGVPPDQCPAGSHSRVPCVVGSSCPIRGAMSHSQQFHPQHEAPSPRAATLLLMVGLPGAGKTTQAKELAAV